MGKEVVVQSTEAKAWDLRAAGRSWTQIAETMGYGSASEAAGSVRAWQRKAAYLIDSMTKTEMLIEEVTRLDILQQAIWVDALQGDSMAIQTAVKIIQARARLLGLEQDAQPVNQTVVVTGDTHDYIQRLRMVSGEK